MTDDNRNLPEWERAFDEYAKNNAPDLLPGILQKINASQNITPAGGPASVQDPELTREPLQTVKGGAEKKPFYLRKNFLRAATGVVAAGILIGLLLLIPNSLRATKRDTMSPASDQLGLSNEVDSNKTVTPTVPTQVAELTDFPQDDRPADTRYKYVYSIAPYSSQNKGASEPYEEEATKPIELANVTIGEKLDSDSDSFYLILVNETVSDSILVHWSGAVPGTQYKNMILAPVSFTARYKDNTYEIRDVLSAE